MGTLRFSGTHIVIIMCFSIACITFLEYQFISAGHNGAMLTVAIGTIGTLVGYVFARKTEKPVEEKDIKKSNSQ